MKTFVSKDALEIALCDLKTIEKEIGKIWVWNQIKECVRRYSGDYILSYLYQGLYQDIQFS